MEQTQTQTVAPTMAERGFRLTALECGTAVDLYSRSEADETSYYHGEFRREEEMLVSLEARCEALGIRFIEPYARRLLRDFTF